MAVMDASEVDRLREFTEAASAVLQAVSNVQKFVEGQDSERVHHRLAFYYADPLSTQMHIQPRRTGKFGSSFARELELD